MKPKPLTTPPQCGWGRHITLTETQHNNADGIPAAKPMVNVYISSLDHCVASMPGFKNGRFDSCEGVALKTYWLTSFPDQSVNCSLMRGQFQPISRI